MTFLAQASQGSSPSGGLPSKAANGYIRGFRRDCLLVDEGGRRKAELPLNYY